MKVAVFGGTGYVGSYIVEELVSQGFTPRLLVRNGSEKKRKEKTKTETKSNFHYTKIIQIIYKIIFLYISIK